jgi:hypothetical protein
MIYNFYKIFKIHNYPTITKKCNFNLKKFNKDKLDQILSPATKEYLKLEKEIQKENSKKNSNTIINNQ